MVKCKRAWLYYDYGRKSEPVKGHVVYNDRGYDDGGYFITEDGSILNGYTVRDEEGVVDSIGYVWFTHRVSEEELDEIYRKYYEEKLDSARADVMYYEKRLKKFNEN